MLKSNLIRRFTVAEMIHTSPVSAGKVGEALKIAALKVSR